MATLAQPRIRERVVSTRTAVAAVLLIWIVLWIPLRGTHTLALASSELTPLHVWLNELNAAVNAGRSSSPFFTYVIDPIRLTIAAVLISLLIGIPLGVWAGVSDRVNRVITPVLDFMQTMPTFVYLAPLTLVFLIGPASATIATLIYAMPPVVRITPHGIRAVPRVTVEAAESLGSTRTQTLTTVLLPMARRTIVLGVNQTIMAALSMATIAALIDAPRLGKTVIKALQSLDVGTAFDAGLAIVVIAIVLDRVTTAAADRAEATHAPSPPQRRMRQRVLAAGAVITAVCAAFSFQYVWASTFPGSGELGSAISRVADAVTAWAQTNLSVLTNGFKDVFTRVVLDSVEALLVQSPWWLTSAAVLALAALLGGLRAAVTAAICLALLIGTGL